MKRRIVIIAVFLICFMTNVLAQNSIDKLVEEYSAVGTNSYTSVVERDPNTLKVGKVINVLKLSFVDAGKFISAFKRESRTGNFTEKYSPYSYKMVLTVGKQNQNRIYVLVCSDPYRPGRSNTKFEEVKVTIVINYR